MPPCKRSRDAEAGCDTGSAASFQGLKLQLSGPRMWQQLVSKIFNIFSKNLFVCFFSLSSPISSSSTFFFFFYFFFAVKASREGNKRKRTPGPRNKAPSTTEGNEYRPQTPSQKMQKTTTWRRVLYCMGERARSHLREAATGKRRRNTKTLWPFCPPHMEKGRGVTFRTPSDLSLADLVGEQFSLDDSIRSTTSVHV